VKFDRPFLGYALLVLVAGLAVGWTIGRDRSAVAEAPRSPAAAPAAAAVPLAPEALPTAAANRDAALQVELERCVRGWKAKALRETRKLAQWNAEDVHVAVSIRAVPSGTEVAGLEAERALRPASNQKLVTTATAIVLLGPRAAFRTPAQLQGELSAGELAGDLVLLGGGDPLYQRENPAHAELRLSAFAHALRERGVQRIRGSIVLDEGDFAAPAPGPAWPSSSQHWQDYCALAAAFSVNGGMLGARVHPGWVGAAASVDLHPLPSGLPEMIAVGTVAGGKSDVQVGANARGITVRGSLGVSVPEVLASFAHPDPVQAFGACLLGACAAEGITVGAGVVRERGRWKAELPIAVVLETPIADVLQAINTDSTNSVADQLYFATGLAAGGAPTRAGGRAATARALALLGVSVDGLVQVDGSGLSRDNRISARQLTALVHAVLASGGEGSAAWRGSLALAGQSGTLGKRLVGTPSEGRVRAKTGFIAGTSALSGIATALDGRERIFSILVNYPEADGINNSCWKPMQDEIVRLLVERLP
jgi:D-alanyl-D-alanine carboxypeptidase/D-alanyl-D-alanine-endopeptidase (penicillin-binding protein 4)